MAVGVPVRSSSLVRSRQKEEGGTYFSRPHLTIPLTASMTPTYRSTLPSFSASSRMRSNSSSNSGSRSTNSFPVAILASASGMSVLVGREAYPSSSVGSGGRVVEGEREMRRERMVSFRATSEPERSSAG